MAIYHLNVKIVSRGNGQSVIASSAYRSGERLVDSETNRVHDYTNKPGVVYSEIMLPNHAPRAFVDRQTLWGDVQQIEKQGNAQLAREVEVALPIELPREKQVEILRNYIDAQFVQEGMVADYSIHDKEDGNPHAHILLTTRPIKADGTWGVKEKKGYALDEAGNRIPQIDPITGEQKLGKRNEKLWKRETIQANTWNDRTNIERWRESWAIECNRYLEKEHQIDHRSHKDRGLEIKPTIHEGYHARKMEQEGKPSQRVAINEETKKQNQQLLELKQIYEELKRFVQEVRERIEQELKRLTRAFEIKQEQLQEREKEATLTDDYYGHGEVSIKQGQYLNIEHKNGFVESYPIHEIESDHMVWGEYRVKKEELFRHAGLYGRIWTSEEREQKIEREQDGGFEIE